MYEKMKNLEAFKEHNDLSVKNKILDFNVGDEKSEE